MRNRQLLRADGTYTPTSPHNNTFQNTPADLAHSIPTNTFRYLQCIPAISFHLLLARQSYSLKMQNSGFSHNPRV